MSVLRRAGVREFALLAALYVGYSLSRTLASDDFANAAGNARSILAFEKDLFLDVEHGLNSLLHAHRWLEVGASFYYAAAHYLITPAVLWWLWRRHRDSYRPMRTAFVAATVAALATFILVPTAPPRLLGGYHDSLALTADVGWWSDSASAPAGMGHLTNQLAAMPSMHVGWALWCALVLWTCARHPAVRWLGVAHAGLTTLVVIGTGNHWTLDVLVGAAMIALAWWLLVPTATAHGAVALPRAHTLLPVLGTQVELFFPVPAGNQQAALTPERHPR